MIWLWLLIGTAFGYNLAMLMCMYLNEKHPNWHNWPNDSRW